MYCVDQTRQEQAQEGSKNKKGRRDSWCVLSKLPSGLTLAIVVTDFSSK